jgi:hypothetical protein
MAEFDEQQAMEITPAADQRNTGIIRVPWFDIVSTYRRYYFELHDTERIKLYFSNGQKVEGTTISVQLLQYRFSPLFER